MSKSKKNTVDPEPIVDQYGADAVRWFMLSDSPARARPAMERGRHRGRVALRPAAVAAGRRARGRRRARTTRSTASSHQTIAGVAADIEALPSTRRSPSSTNWSTRSRRPRRRRRAPPRSARWSGSSRRWRRILPRKPGPRWAKRADRRRAMARRAIPALLVEDEVTIAMQVNGKLRDTLVMPKGTPTGKRRGGGTRRRARSFACSTATHRRR